MSDDDEGYAELTDTALAHRWRRKTLLEYVDEAVSEGTPGEEYATPEAALKWLLRNTWSDLERCRREAVNGVWSIACDAQVARIAGITQLVGPTPWAEIPAGLLLDGVYERVHQLIGTPTPLSDADRQYAAEVWNRNHAPHRTPGSASAARTVQV